MNASRSSTLQPLINRAKSMIQPVADFLGRFSCVENDPTPQRVLTPEERERRTEQHKVLGLCLFGAVLVGIGLISISGHNWTDLGPRMKTLAALLPPLGFGALAVRYLLKGQPWSTGRETTGVLFVLSVGAAMGLIWRTWDIQTGYASFLALWLILTAAVPLILRASGAQFAVMLLALLWLIAAKSTDSFTAWWTIVLGGGGIMLVLLHLSPSTHRRDLIGFSLFVLIGLGMLAKSTNATELNLTILTMSGLGLASARVFLADKTRQSVLTVLSAACGLALLGMATSPAIVYGEFSRSWPTIAYDGTVLAQIAIAACVALYAVASVVHRRRLSLHTTAILFALVPATVAWHLMPISPLSTIVVANCGVATIALAIAIYGVREDDSTWTTIGCILAFGLILLRLSDADEPRLVVGTLLVGVGIGVLLMARAYLLRKKDPLAAQDEPATAEQLDLPTNNAPQPE